MPRNIPDRAFLTIKTKQNILKQWEAITEELTNQFVKKHFGKSASYYFIGDEIGGTIEVCDSFFSLDDIVGFMRYKYTSKQMFDYYDERLEKAMIEEDEEEKKVMPNIKNWKKINS